MAFFNELTLRRMRAFKKRKTAYYSLWFFLVLFVVGMLAELLANDRPYLMKYDGKIYFPLFKNYHPKEFGIDWSYVMDYKEFEAEHKDDVWMLFPPIPWGPYAINKFVEEYPSPPSRENILGTDDRGRDVAARLIYGFRTSMIYSVGVWILSFIIGIIIGGIQGYFGGKVDFLGQRILEIYSSIPYFFLLLILISIFQPNIWMLVALSSIFGWVNISMYMRAEFLRLRKFDFVEASRALGMRHGSLIFKQIMPNALNPVITFSPFRIAGGVVALAGLDYLGFGLAPPAASWGEMLSQAHRYYDIAPWLMFSTMAAIFGTVSLLNMVGEGVRHAFDPRKY